MTPTALSLRYLRAEGYEVEVVEKWNSFAKIRQDLFGIIDILALKPGVTLGVQSTTAANVASRVNKVMASPKLVKMLEAGWTVHVHGWLKRPNGKWVLHRIEDMAP